MNNFTIKWYAIWHDNFKKNEIRNVFLCDKRLILIKSSKSKYNCLSSVCTHMWVNLSKGKVIKDCLVCPFHGLRFNMEGRSSWGKLEKYPTRVYFWIIWIFDGEKPTYELQETVPNFFPNTSKYYTIPVYDDIHKIPSDIIQSNFFDVAHFHKIHWITVTSSTIKQTSTWYYYEFVWKYISPYFFQKILFYFLPNSTKNIILYTQSINYSKHQILSKKWKVIFEYYGVFPVTPSKINSTQVVSSILIKKWFYGVLWKCIARYFITKATQEEFEILEGIDDSVKNFNAWDSVLEGFFDYYRNEK